MVYYEVWEPHRKPLSFCISPTTERKWAPQLPCVTRHLSFSFMHHSSAFHLRVTHSRFLWTEAPLLVALCRAARQWSERRPRWRQPRGKRRAKPGDWTRRSSDYVGGRMSWKMRWLNSTGLSMRPSCWKAGWETKLAGWRWENSMSATGDFWCACSVYNINVFNGKLKREKKHLEESLAEIREQEEEMSRANRMLNIRLEDVQVRVVTLLEFGGREIYSSSLFPSFFTVIICRRTWPNWTLRTRSLRTDYRRRSLRRSSLKAWRTTLKTREGCWTGQWKNFRGRWGHLRL